MIHFLQITESSPAKATAVAGDINKDGFLSLWELLSTGGWIMIPLGIMFLLAVYVHNRLFDFGSQSRLSWRCKYDHDG